MWKFIDCWAYKYNLLFMREYNSSWFVDTHFTLADMKVRIVNWIIVPSLLYFDRHPLPSIHENPVLRMMHYCRSHLIWMRVRVRIHRELIWLCISSLRDLQKLPLLVMFHTNKAGHWLKFSTSNDRTSGDPHRLRYCHCAKLTKDGSALLLITCSVFLALALKVVKKSLLQP